MKLKFTSRYLRNENGSLSVEAVFAIPLLAWAIAATFVFFDAFKTLNVAQKATYTIVDMISREEVAVDDAYITALHETFHFLSARQALGPSGIRVTVVEMTTDEDTGDEVLELVWSESRNYPFPDLENVDPIVDRIPGIAPGEQLVMVESIQQWEPAFGVGLAKYHFREVALSRPRFAPKICWETTAGCTTPSAPPAGGSSDDGTI